MKIRVAVIGAGHWGPNLIRNFRDHGASEVTWVVELDEVRRAQVKGRYPEVAVTGDANEAIGDPSVDAVVITTPTSTHATLTRAALEHGKHVLVEKPMSDDAASAEGLCALAAEHGLVLMVGHVFVYNAAVQRVKHYLDEDALGRLYYISMVRTNLGPIRMDVNASWDLAAHDVSIANYWLDAQPVTACAIGGTWINPGIEDAVFATLRYPDDVLVNLDVSWLNPRKAREITLVGERRMLTLDDMNLSEPLRMYDKGVTEELTTPAFVDTFASFRASIREGDITIPRVSAGEPLRMECEHFLDCIEFSKQPLTGGAEGVAVVRVLEAIDESIRNRGAETGVR